MMKDYQKRMVSEFNDLRDRSDKLEKIIRKQRHGKLEFELACPIRLLVRQHNAMLDYLECLKERAIEEDIDLEY